MAKRISRRIELFGMHLHNGPTGGYEEIFERLRIIRRNRRVVRVGALVLAFPIVRKIGNLYFIQITEGDPDSAGLVLDATTGETRENVLAENEVLSEATHLLVDPANRRATIEYVRRGAKAIIIASALEGVLQRSDGLRSIRFEFSPIMTSEFEEEIDRFSRIREARIRIVKPNASWSDHYTELSALIESSNGEKAELDIKAGRGESLSKTNGIVKVLRDVVSDAQPYLEEASLTGIREGETAETTIRSSHHVVHTRESIPVDGAGVPSQDTILQRLRSLLAAWT